MKIAFVTDSSAGITQVVAQEMNITVIRMPLLIDGQDFLEEVEITREALIDAMINGKSVGTSQPNLQYTLEKIESLLETHDHVMYLPISKELSGTYENMVFYEKEFEGKLTVVDTKSVSWLLRIMVSQGQELAEKGYTPADIKRILEDDSFLYAILIPEDLQYLKRGGRIKPAAAAVANLLRIVPILSVTDTGIDLYDKVRTHRKALLKGFEKITEYQPYDDYEWAVLDGGTSPELVDAFVADLENVTGCEVHKGKMYPIVLSHTGPGTIAFAAIKKIKELR